MKRFTFRLTRLARLREAERLNARVALAGALGQLADARGLRLAAAATLEEGERHYLDGAPPPEAHDVRACAEWLEGQRWREREATRREHEAAARVREAEDIHAGCHRRVRVLDRLREGQFQRWRDEALAEEQRTLDEIHLLRLAGRGSTGGTR